MSPAQNPARIFGVFNEMIFVLVGVLLLWVAMTGRYVGLNPRGTGWIILSAVILLWGLWTWRQGRRIVKRTLRLATKIGAGSLVLTGMIMAALAWAPFVWVGQLLAAAGTVFIVRGIVTAALLAFSS
jgi:hypothetical protein